MEIAFEKKGIPFDTPGFYDHPNFIKQEQRDPRFLELYAEYVESRAYDFDYLTAAEQKITIAASALESAVRADGRLGACVDVSGMLGRILDRLGVWNYVAKATLTITFPKPSGISIRYFWNFDVGEFVAPHAMVVAPPFGVVDLTARKQAYSSGEPDHIPNIILAKEWSLGSWKPEDLANPIILADLHRRRISFDTFMNEVRPDTANIIQSLPVRIVQEGETTFKYVIVAVGGTIEPLEGVTGYRPGGRTALEIFEQAILPTVHSPESNQG
ncbi:MAG: hypothetical protein HQL99_11310 [Magnetococcales bacterium]|nr:hypothetical protein [Magnetococcales bacterium]